MDYYNTTQSFTNQTSSYDYTDSFADDVSSWIHAVKLMRSIFVPCIVALGLFGNILCLFVFLTKNMRSSSCSAFLIALAIVDVSFLICLLLIWIDGDVKTVMTTDGACQVLIFVTYTSSFLNAWFIVGFTCERFIAICMPLRHVYLCNIFREKVVVTLLCIFGCALYSFSFWTSGVVINGRKRVCYHKMKYFGFLSVVTWIDTFLTMLIPFCIIVCVNSVVLLTVLKSSWNSANRVSAGVYPNRSERGLLKNVNLTGCIRKTTRFQGVQRSVNQLRVARTLFVISLIFVFLNLPSHAIRLYNLIDTSIAEYHSVSVEFYFFQECTVMLYYVTYSCNFILYTLFGRNFKESLLLLLRCKSSSKVHKQKMLEKLSSTQGTCTSQV